MHITLEVNGEGRDANLEPRVGEIGQVRVAAAIGNAVFNATGRRIRELPLAAELVMDPARVPA